MPKVGYATQIVQLGFAEYREAVRVSMATSIIGRLRHRALAAEQAAAVCYRISRSSLEFLLVNTSSGKWTFPKGRINPGMSAGESAALEAWEEAGAHGRIADRHLDYYLDSKRALGHDAHSREIRVAAYLFEVHSTIDPEETHRNPTWFSAHRAKQQLAVGRTPEYAAEITRIVDSAMRHLKHRRSRGTSIVRAAARRRLAAAR